MSDELNFFSEIDEMTAEIDGLRNSGNRVRKKRKDQENSNLNFDAMLGDIEESKQSPGNVIFDVTVKQTGSARGDYAKREKYKGLGLDGIDLIAEKYR